MNIQQDGQNHFKVTILAEQQGTKEMIQTQVNEIKQTMAETGIKIDKIEVQLSGNFGESSTDERYSAANSGNSGNKKQQQSHQSQGHSNADGSNGRVQNRAGPDLMANGRLDLVA
jgi:flagellar hook-length control protein FliK